MYATKTPSLRIEQSDLKCKSGCDFYGNAQWQGYCSKCHREQVHRQRKAEKNNSEASSTQREHQPLDRQPKSSQITGFTKFEEKKLRQSDSLKKNKLLKLNVFRKSSSAKDIPQSEREIKDKSRSISTLPAAAIELQKREFNEKFPKLGSTIERDTRKYIQYFYSNISKQFQLKTIDELSELTQNLYQVYAKHMDDNVQYSDIDAETRELLLDFVEKHSMTYLHSIIFSPYNCDDEKKDEQIHSRIRQLSWVSPPHLDCRIDQGNIVARDLLHSAITELVAVDSVLSPGEKLSHIVGCCRGVVGVVSAGSGGPASADELLPALIFTVLKANPSRLTSNINFITRFSNAARLMTGEGGYYFTNLCCAVSFIENLTPESLNMTKDDFDRCMSLPAAVRGGSWVAALSLCEGLHDLQDQLKSLKELEGRTVNFSEKVQDLNEQISIFKEEIVKKVADVLNRTPLELKPRMGGLNSKFNYEEVIIQPISSQVQEPIPDTDLNNKIKSKAKCQDIFGSSNDDTTAALIESISAPIPSDYKTPEPLRNEISYNTKHLIPPNSLVNLSLDNTPVSTLKALGSNDFLSPSPIFGFDSLDDLMTPDEFGNELVQTLSNVNYDIDLSDLSTENSVAEDIPNQSDGVKLQSQDPFSPDGLTQPIYGNIWTATERFKFDNDQEPLVSIVENEGEISILDANDSPTVDALLPSPIKPSNTQDPFTSLI